MDEEKQRLKLSGYVATIWYATSKNEGHTWKKQGEALDVGRKDSFDAQAVFTPDINQAIMPIAHLPEHPPQYLLGALGLLR